MAEILIMAINKTRSDPDLDARGCYKLGDIVEIFEDGKMQDPPAESPFILVRIPGVAKTRLLKYIRPQEEFVPEIKRIEESRWLKVKANNETLGYRDLPIEVAPVKLAGKNYMDIQGEVVEIKKKRIYRLRIEDLPLPVKKELKTNRAVTVTLIQIKSFIHNKVTNLSEA